MCWFLPHFKSRLTLTCPGSATHLKSSSHNPKAKVSTSTAHLMEEFVSMWKLAKASSPKLNYYHQIKHEFLPEKYLSLVKIPEARNSLTRFCISSHNLFIERGRYETPIIPRENRWCLHCYFTTGVKTLEDEIHALATCPLYNVVRGRFGFSPDQNELIDSLSDQSLTPARATTIAKTIHAILSINEKHVEYYKAKVPTPIITLVAVLYFNIYPT